MSFFAEPRACCGFRAAVEDRDLGVLVITFDQPKAMNGMTHGMKRDLLEVLAQAQMDDTVRVVVLHGEGHFSAGDSLTPRPGQRSTLVAKIGAGHNNPIGTYNGLRQLSQTVNTAVRSLDKITIAAMEGFAIQTGFSLALSCDLRIASQKARMGSATLRFALLPDEGGQYLLVRLLGEARALEFMLRKRIVTGPEALQMGLVGEVVPPEELKPAAMRLARELADGPQVAMRMLKRSVRVAADSSWEQSLEDIATKTAITDHHPDTKAGVASFRTKSKPRFNAWIEEKVKRAKL